MWSKSQRVAHKVYYKFSFFSRVVADFSQLKLVCNQEDFMKVLKSPLKCINSEILGSYA